MTSLVPLLLGAMLASGVAPAPSVHRVAVIVGANKAAAGRNDLRFSYADAASMATVLEQLGQFRAEDIVVLEDPDPAAVLTALDEKLLELPGSAAETLLLFYYSGHADEQALYPNGKPLPYQELRQRLDAPAATVRIGIIDACSGGGWTRAKGLHPEDSFEVAAPMTLSSEGSMLIASSSGVERARESDAIGGSFFTHHFVAGLRGAADQTGDGRVTVTEAFDYARALTVRDSAINGDVPQHPSFATNLRGRGEVTLTYVNGNASTVNLTQTTGPLQLIQLDTGLIVLEAPLGPRALHLGIAPGRYLVRRQVGKDIFAREVTIEAGTESDIDEQSLTLVNKQWLMAKRFDTSDPTSNSVPAHAFTLRFELGGYSSTTPFFTPGETSGAAFKFPLSLFWHPTEKLQISILQPSVRYVFGDRKSIELITHLGMFDTYIAKNSDGEVELIAPMGGYVAVRKWLDDHQSVHLGLEGTVDGYLSSQGFHVPQSWNTSLIFGYAYSSSKHWTTNIDLSVSRNLTDDGSFLPLKNDDANAITVNLGSSRLLQFRLNDSLMANLGASLGWDFGSHQPASSLNAGISWGFF